jgi:Second Messenger Oligonucleotide or Dinucleotide Synthetase domain
MARSVNEGFTKFIADLKPLQSEHDRAAAHRASVKSCLEKNFDCYNFFETGSFGNGTGVRHHSDTDYFAICPSNKLWNSSQYTLGRFREALKATFWNTDGISVNTPAVSIPFGTYASETMEITPAIFNGLIDTPHGKKGYYSIPDYDDGWIQSSPDAHNSYVSYHDQRLGGKLKPLIQLIKAWKYINNAPISSFYLELRTTKYAEGETSIVYDIDVKNILKYLADNDLPMLQDPMKVSGYVKACSTAAKFETALTKIKADAERATKAVTNRESNVDEAFRLWNLVFYNKFPSR